MYLQLILFLLFLFVGRTDNPDVVAALLQLHHHVDESSDATLNTLAQSLVVLGQNPP